MKKTKELSPYEKICMNRIRKLIDEFCAGSQQRFVEKTGLNKGSVSQYVNGKNIPSESNARKIAEAFDVDIAWIMGYDAIPNGIIRLPHEEAEKLYRRYMDAPPNIRAAVQALLGSDVQDP